MNNLLDGIFRIAVIVTGSKIKPAEIILIDATWKAVKCTNPSFIKIKLLPQIKESAIKRNQLINFELMQLNEPQSCINKNYQTK